MTIGAAQVNAREPRKGEVGSDIYKQKMGMAPEPVQTQAAAPRPKVDLEDLDGGLTLLQYQLAAHNTAIYPQVGTGGPVALAYLFLKLNGEAGEAGEKYAKIIRDKGSKGSLEDREEILKELGDVLWYIAMLADELDESLEEVAKRNIAKLKDRQDRGVLGGSGDNR
jgi:NTP pyrophosphatase (non-canonical NTP hydrolase)